MGFLDAKLIRRTRFRFGIGSLLIMTAVVAIAFRLTHQHGTVDITFRDLEFDSKATRTPPTQTVPPRISGLHKKHVRIRGYIYPLSVFRAKGIKRFVLARDNYEPITNDGDCVIVRMNSESAVDYTTRPVTVTGVFSVRTTPVAYGNGTLYYEIAADEVGS